MSISPTQGNGPYFDDNGWPLVGGVLQFLDPDTVSPKSVYADESLTTLADNPIELGSDGRLPYQVFYGTGNYLVRQYELIDEDIVSPVFPDDYTALTEWIDAGISSDAVSTSGSLHTVDTINDLVAVDPNAHETVQVIGYYSKDDNIDNRTYKWNPLSVATADGGSVIASGVLGSGRWELKSSVDTIDIRWFGALEGSGNDSNAGIQAACSFASSSSLSPTVSVYFPAGTYQVVSATISTVANVKIDEKFELFNRLAGDFVLDAQGRYEIDKATKIQNASSVGHAFVKLSNSTYGHEFNVPVNESIYESLNDALINAGTNPVLVKSAKALNLTEDLDDRSIIFTGSGSITSVTGTHTLNIAKVVTDDDTVTRFDYSAALPDTISFDSKHDLLTGWFGDNDLVFYNIAKNVSNVVINKDMVISSVAMNLSTINSLRSTGGSFKVGDNQTVDLPSRVIGEVIEFTGTSDTAMITSTGTLKSRNFVLESGHAVAQYVRLATQNQSVVVFEGEVFTFECILDYNFDISLSNVTFQGDVSCTSTMTVDNVRMFGNFYGNGHSLIANNSTIAITNNASISLQNLVLRNSIFSANNCPGLTVDFDLGIHDSSFDFPSGSVLARRKAIIKNSTINIGPSDHTNINTLKSDEIDIRESTLNSVHVRGTMASQSESGTDVIIRFFDNICNGTYVGPEGNQASVDTILIERNDFRIIENVPHYYPITHVSFVPQTSSYEAIHIANNLPVIDTVDLAWDQTSKPNKPNVGTWVAQTDVKFKWEFPSATPALLNIPTNVTFQDVFWTPPQLLIVTSGTGINDNTAIHQTEVQGGYGGASSFFINDYATDLNKGTGGAGGPAFEGIPTSFNGGSGTIRGQFHVDFFKH